MKREQLIQELRKIARTLDLELEILQDRGKGSHYRVKLNGRITIIKSGDLSPTYVRLVRKQLGLE